jgi:hypothetical protein
MVDWAAVGSVATAVGAVGTAVAAVFIRMQLRDGQQQAQSAFEDQLEREYRELIAELPVGALLGADPETPLPPETLGVFYRYIDLTNQQVFLRCQNRIRLETWTNWCEGIAHQLRRPAFEAAWLQIKDQATEDFSELRRLERSGFTDDPFQWASDAAFTAPGQDDPPAVSRAA